MRSVCASLCLTLENVVLFNDRLLPVNDPDVGARKDEAEHGFLAN